MDSLRQTHSLAQEIRVLRCFKCKTFQADIVKKANKWKCKICHEQQSVFREFFRGTGADCRQKVQEFNYNEKSKENDVENAYLDLLNQQDLDVDPELLAKEERRLRDSIQADRGDLWTQLGNERKLHEPHEPKRKRKPRFKSDIPYIRSNNFKFKRN